MPMRIHLPCWVSETRQTASLTFDLDRDEEFDRRLSGWARLEMADFVFEGPSYMEGALLLDWLGQLQLMTTGHCQEAVLWDWDRQKCVSLRSASQGLPYPVRVACQWAGFYGAADPEEIQREYLPGAALCLSLSGLRADSDQVPRLIEQVSLVLEKTGVSTERIIIS